MRVLVVVNPGAGLPQPVLRILNDTLGRAGHDWDVALTRRSGDGEAAARRAAASGVDLVAACGGDGTVMEVAGALAGTGVPMAILPAGTANLMACELGLPYDLPGAAALLVRETPTWRDVDLGRAAGRPFLLRLGVGYEGRKVQAATRELKDQWGILAYTLAALQELEDPRPARYRLVLDGREVECEALSCVIANAGNFGVSGLSFAPTASVSDGLLDVFLFRDFEVASLLTAAARVLGGDPEYAGFSHWQARRITLETRPHQVVHADGEVWGPMDLEVEAVPAAVRVLVP